MDDLLAHLVKALVEKPDEIDVLVDESQTSNDVTLIIDSNPDDVPLIIGRKGRTIKALRNIISILALKDRQRINIQVKHQKPREEKVFEKSETPSEVIAESEEEEKTETKKTVEKPERRMVKPKRISERNSEPTETEDILGF